MGLRTHHQHHQEVAVRTCMHHRACTVGHALVSMHQQACFREHAPPSTHVAGLAPSGESLAVALERFVGGVFLLLLPAGLVGTGLIG